MALCPSFFDDVTNLHTTTSHGGPSEGRFTIGPGLVLGILSLVPLLGHDDRPCHVRLRTEDCQKARRIEVARRCQRRAAITCYGTEPALSPKGILCRSLKRAVTRRVVQRCACCPTLAHALSCSQVAEARSDETFVALCLLTVTGASLLTQKLGFSDTMGAFVAGVLLAETNYSTQVRPLSSGPDRGSPFEP